MHPLLIALLILVAVIAGVIVLGLLAQRLIKGMRPSSQAVQRVSGWEAVMWIAVVIGSFTAYSFLPSDGVVIQFLSNWYGWPVAIVAASVAVYVIAFVVTVARLLLSRQSRNHGA